LACAGVALTYLHRAANRFIHFSGSLFFPGIAFCR